EHRAADRHATADPAEESKTMTVPRRHPRQPKQPRQLDAGPLEPQIGSFRLHLAAEGKAARTVQGYTSAVRWFAAGYLLGQAGQGRSFAARRDAAIIAVFTATGIRLAELAGIRYHPDDPARNDLDLQGREIRIRGKGGAARTVKIGHQAARSLDRYLRARARH